MSSFSTRLATSVGVTGVHASSTARPERTSVHTASSGLSMRVVTEVAIWPVKVLTRRVRATAHWRVRGRRAVLSAAAGDSEAARRSDEAQSIDGPATAITARLTPYRLGAWRKSLSVAARRVRVGRSSTWLREDSARSRVGPRSSGASLTNRRSRGQPSRVRTGQVLLSRRDDLVREVLRSHRRTRTVHHKNVLARLCHSCDEPDCTTLSTCDSSSTDMR